MNSNSQIALAVDLGGTNLRVGVVDEIGQVLESQSCSSVKAGKNLLVTLGDLLERLAENSIRPNHELKGVALGIPGIVDGSQGVVYQSPHFPDWDQLEVLSYFRRRFSCPVIMDNDANLIALGELWKGTGQGLENFLLLTLGTGVGGAIIINKQIFHGDSGFAGEFGHVVIEQDGFHCHCGSRGCLEMYVSATGIKELILHAEDLEKETFLKKAGQDIDHLTIERLYQLTLEGDTFGHVLFRTMGHSLGVGIASLVNVLGIFNVLIGGGISAASDFFLPAAEKELSGRTYRETAKRVKILKCQLGDAAGLIGGASQFLWK